MEDRIPPHFSTPWAEILIGPATVWEEEDEEDVGGAHWKISCAEILESQIEL